MKIIEPAPMTAANVVSSTATGTENQWKMFDEFVNTETEVAENLTVVISVDQIDHIAFFEVTANDLKVEVLDDANVPQWEYYIDLLSASLDFGDWWEFFYLPYPEPQRDIIVTLPWIISSAVGEKIRITMTSGGTVKCGLCRPGMELDIGLTEWGPSFRIIDFSRKETNEFGQTYLLQGKFAKLISGTIDIPAGSEGFVFRTLTRMRGKAAVWDLNNPGTAYDPLIAFGFLEDFQQVLNFHNHTTLSIDIQGLT